MNCDNTCFKFHNLFNSLLNDRIVDCWSILKTFADDKMNCDLKSFLRFVFGRVENIVRKGENTGYHYFLLFPHCVQKVSFSGALKVRIV